MNGTFYPPIFKNIKINQFKIVDIKVKLFETASFTVLLFDIDNNLCETRQYTLTEDEYVEWGNDDTYLVKLTKNRLQNESQQKSENNTQNNFVGNA